MSEKICRKQVSFTTKASEDDSSVIYFIASTDDIDRHGDIIDQKGWDLSNWLKNPVILVDHDNRVEKVVGKGISAEITDGKMIIGVKFASEESQLAALVHKLVKGGFVNAVSVGFMPDFDTMEFKKTDEGTVTIIKNSELLELSIVGIPANAAALRKAYDQKAINEKDVKALKAEFNLEEGGGCGSCGCGRDFEKKWKVVAEKHDEQKALRKFFSKVNKLIGFTPEGEMNEDLEGSAKLLESVLKGDCGLGGGCGSCGKLSHDVIQNGEDDDLVGRSPEESKAIALELIKNL